MEGFMIGKWWKYFLLKLEKEIHKRSLRKKELRLIKLLVNNDIILKDAQSFVIQGGKAFNDSFLKELIASIALKHLGDLEFDAIGGHGENAQSFAETVLNVMPELGKFSIKHRGEEDHYSSSETMTASQDDEVSAGAKVVIVTGVISDDLRSIIKEAKKRGFEVVAILALFADRTSFPIGGTSRGTIPVFRIVSKEEIFTAFFSNRKKSGRKSPFCLRKS